MRTILLGTLAVMSSFLNAQTTSEARQLLDEVKANIESYSDQSFDFTSTIEIPTGDPDNPVMTRESSGSMTIVGENYKVETDGQIAILNGDRAYIIVPADEEVTIRNLGEENANFTPQSVVERFENGSSLSMAGKETIDGKQIQYVRVHPNASEEIRDIVLGIDMSTKRVYSYTEYGVNNVVTKYVISNYRVNRGLDPSVVEYKSSDYEGWRINEPRSRRR